MKQKGMYRKRHLYKKVLCFTVVWRMKTNTKDIMSRTNCSNITLNCVYHCLISPNESALNVSIVDFSRASKIKGTTRVNKLVMSAT